MQPDEQLRSAVAECARITRKCARNFYYGLRLTPQPQRDAMFVIYAWMRGADDLADSAGFSPAERVARIAEYRRATERALAGSPVDNQPVWRGLAWVSSQHSLSAQDFHDMLDGQVADVGTATYATWEELRSFCYRVASTVGLVCIRVWGYTHPDAPALAIDRGIAFQLTNILRDYAEDFDMGRVYLPQDEFRRIELTPHDVRVWSKPDLCSEFMLAQCTRAEQFYKRSAALESMITPGCVPTLWAMTEIYHGLLARIAARPQAVSQGHRIRLSPVRKAWIAFKAQRMSAETSRPVAGSSR